jgi:hypothetical protein
MNPRLSNIHANKLAKHNYKYLDSNGDVYIGTKDGRLTKVINPVVNTTILNTGLISAESTNTNTNTNQETNLSPFLLMGG